MLIGFLLLSLIILIKFIFVIFFVILKFILFYTISCYLILLIVLNTEKIINLYEKKIIEIVCLNWREIFTIFALCFILIVKQKEFFILLIILCIQIIKIIIKNNTKLRDSLKYIIYVLFFILLLHNFYNLYYWDYNLLPLGVLPDLPVRKLRGSWNKAMQASDMESVQSLSYVANNIISRGITLLQPGANLVDLYEGLHVVGGGWLLVKTTTGSLGILGIWVGGDLNIPTQFKQGFNPFNRNLAFILYEIRSLGFSHWNYEMLKYSPRPDMPELHIPREGFSLTHWRTIYKYPLYLESMLNQLENRGQIAEDRFEISDWLLNHLAAS